LRWDILKIERFEDLESWKEARKLVAEVYAIFGTCRDAGFKDQVQRAATSTMSNIAEGFDRGTNKELVQYLVIARGSASEVKSLCYAASDIGYLSDSSFESITRKCTNLSNMINGFIRYLKNSDRKK
jgi:four helix bundle protein